MMTAPVIIRVGPPSRVNQSQYNAVTINTVVSVGILSAFLWSLYALLFGTA
ncbi:hypothetical protein [Mycobacterium uberis]|uniref:hypothetical protein n=1 Tax=Mycobacterium uberis TaxID=2162698 RepID=UPI001403D757|nr:hypothetical protein [Mycobacterium uberis]